VVNNNYNDAYQRVPMCVYAVLGGTVNRERKEKDLRRYDEQGEKREGLEKVRFLLETLHTY